MIPAYVNPRAGTAAEAAKLLRDDRRFQFREMTPARLGAAMHRDAEAGIRRIAVCGGDGTLATAATAAVELGIELAVIPGGTLNHFARRIGVPSSVAEAVAVAAESPARPVDVGYVNERLFLNTSSIGAYVAYVRLRERTERWLGYRFASATAALRLLFRLRSTRVRLELGGDSRTVATPLIFVGVGERRLATPRFGEPVRDGDRSLHVLVVNGSAPARHLVRALAAAARGREEASETPSVDSFLVEALVIEMPLPTVRVALDGEIHAMRAPLRYRVAREHLLAVTPPPAGRRHVTTE